MPFFAIFFALLLSLMGLFRVNSSCPPSLLNRREGGLFCVSSPSSSLPPFMDGILSFFSPVRLWATPRARQERIRWFYKVQGFFSSVSSLLGSG